MLLREENTIESRNCKHCNTQFDITDVDAEFYEKISPEVLKQKFIIPFPTLCPDCRQQRRLSCRNEKSLYTRKCDQSGDNIISIYSPDKPYKVFKAEYWWSDDWDACDYGIDYDFNLSFFENYKKLDLLVPKLSTTIQNSENCEYTNDTWDSKDCYMSYRTHYSENIMHSYRANKSTDCVDCYQVKQSSNLYECFQSNVCNNAMYLYKCENTHTSYFLYNCTWSANCFLSYNLTNANYTFLNKTYEKEVYMGKITEVLNDPVKFEEAKQVFFSFIHNRIPSPALDNFASENCSWNELIESLDCKNCFMMKWCEWCRHGWDNVNYKYSMDTYSWGWSEYSYETLATKNSFKNSFTHRVKESNNLLYCMFSFFSNNCFGCVGIKNKEYCILNKQYSKDEYDELLPKIIHTMIENWEWWEFFPANISPFGYNETVANQYFPLSEKEIKDRGFNYSTYEQAFPQVEKLIPAAKLPVTISDIPDDILNWAVECEVTKKPFKIVEKELEFYRKRNISLPKRHPDVRHADRTSFISPRKLIARKCSTCEKSIISPFPTGSQKKVLCTECFSQL